MKKIVCFILLLIFVFGCSTPNQIYTMIKKKYPNSQIIKLEGDSDQYIVYTENKEIRFINVYRFGGSPVIEINQKINLINRGAIK